MPEPEDRAATEPADASFERLSPSVRIVWLVSRTVFWLIPAISVYTIVLGFVSLSSSLVDRSGDTAHRCARAWSWLILRTTGVNVAVEGLERLTPGTTYIFIANHQSHYDDYRVPYCLK